MKAGWEVERLGNLCEIYQPKTISKKMMIPDGKYPVFGANGIIGKYDKYNHENSELLITCRGATCGAVNVSKDYSWINGNAMVVRPKDDRISKSYLEYFFRGAVDLDGVITGAAQPQITRKSLAPVWMSFPPLEEQKRIVAILDEAFAGLDRARAHTEANLQNARDLFEAFLYGVFQTGEEKWEQKEWGNICNFVRGPFGGSLKKSMFVDKGYAVYEQKHAIHDHFNQLRYFIDEEKFSEMRRFEVKAGDLIMSCSGVTLGRVAIIPDGIPKGIINQALLKLTPSEILSVDFLKHWLRSKIFQDIIFEHAGGAAIPNVPSAKILKKILLPVPSLEEQNQLVAEIDSMLERTKSMEGAYKTKLTDLDDLRQSLLQKAFAGELT